MADQQTSPWLGMNSPKAPDPKKAKAFVEDFQRTRSPGEIWENLKRGLSGTPESQAGEK